MRTHFINPKGLSICDYTTANCMNMSNTLCTVPAVPVWYHQGLVRAAGSCWCTPPSSASVSHAWWSEITTERYQDSFLQSTCTMGATWIFLFFSLCTSQHLCKAYWLSMCVCLIAFIYRTYCFIRIALQSLKQITGDHLLTRCNLFWRVR